jgi:hypothetical protein
VWQNLVSAVEQNNRPKYQSAINQIKKEFQDYKNAQTKASPHDVEKRRALEELEKVLLPSLEEKGNIACRYARRFFFFFFLVIVMGAANSFVMHLWLISCL